MVEDLLKTGVGGDEWVFDMVELFFWVVFESGSGC